MWTNTSIGVFISDIHLSHNVPTYRGTENNWYEAMGRCLNEVVEIADSHKCPLFIAGDIFHTWKSPATLINFAIKNMRARLGTFIIPGQHDLPYHSYDDVDQSPYKTLLLTEGFKELGNSPESTYFNKKQGVEVYGYIWGSNLEKGPYSTSKYKKIALIHHYVWKKGHTFPGAPQNGRASTIIEKLNKYDLIFCGDNHKKFRHKHLINCGNFLVRNQDDCKMPVAYVVQQNLEILEIPIKSNQLNQYDSISDKDNFTGSSAINNVIKILNEENDHTLDFPVACRLAAEKSKKEVKRLILECLE